MLSSCRKRSLGKESRDREDCRDISEPQLAGPVASASASSSSSMSDISIGGGTPGPSISRLTDLMKKVRIDLSSGEMR